jgi:hypothetical protein
LIRVTDLSPGRVEDLRLPSKCQMLLQRVSVEMPEPANGAVVAGLEEVAVAGVDSVVADGAVEADVLVGEEDNT